MKYKKWSLEKKLEILASSEEIGIVETCRKYSVSSGSLYSWKKKHENQGEAGLKVTYDDRSKIDLAEKLNPKIRGWIHYYGKIKRNSLKPVFY